MGDSNILWKDKGISFYNMFVIYCTMAMLLITPLIPLAFGKFENVKYIILCFYFVNGIVFMFLSLNIYYENKRWLYFNENGIVIKWHPETGNTYEMFNWNKLKRINLFSSWNPKNYLRWKKIKNTLSYSLFFSSALYDNMLIIETRDDDIYFIGINDFEGFVKNIKNEVRKNPFLNQLPIMNYAARW